MTSLSFSGHDSFHCRQFWLKKAFDHSSENEPYNDSATLKLGVGRNMVTAIRHWGRCFGILDENDRPTSIGGNIFSDKGWDPYLEDEGTLWLLHYLLVTEGKASTFSLVFNELIKLRPELTPEYYISFVNSREQRDYNESTLKRDFQVFYQTYYGDFSSNDIEESFTGILSELKLLKKIQKQVLDTEGALRKRDVWVVERTVRNEIPLHILLYGILQNHPGEQSIGFESLYNGWNSIGSVFALSKDGLTQALDRIAKELNYGITFSNEAGIRELQLKQTIEPMTVLTKYYDNN